ncbi:RHS repeat-associated core domain-containing protein [Pantoea sp. At-9b]|uniref:RHS repeat-associated core domain-containing protein n=1 Tax=Pantoea sp. (strain At-9b) TaxID=592316 RepID=UPI00167F949A|nr:RHS repeat-associated core domain-containing protein [Pantoea sp. At-9b]
MKSFQQKAARLVQRYKVRYLNGIEIRTRDDETRSGEIHRVIYVANARIYYRTSAKTADSHIRQVRYRFSDRNGNARLEIAADATMISREDYYPFGGTAIWLTRSQMGAEYKTHRYAGHERDKTGLIHYGWRYYLPWLMRWLNPDPAGTVDGSNLFCMVKNNPATLRDINGCVATSSDQSQPSARQSSFMDNAGKFPFRLSGTPFKLRGFTIYDLDKTRPLPQDAQAKLKSFIDPGLSEASRKDLYLQNVRVEAFTSDDVSTSPNRRFIEQRLIGQEKLVAARDLAKGTCIGVYGGEVMSEDEVLKLDIDKQINLLGGEGVSHKFFWDGDNPMAKMNTIFELNQAGNDITQATSGYNVENILAMATLDKSSPRYAEMNRIEFVTFFTAQDVKEGEELRWNYGYQSRIINKILARRPVNPASANVETSPQALAEAKNQSYAFAFAVLGMGLVIALALWMAYV